MKYQSELLKEIIDKEGHITSLLHYQSECVETFIKDAKGSYPKLCDYEGEWLNYINTQSCIGEFPYVTLSDVTEATVNNVVPYEYKSAILKGNTLVNLATEKSGRFNGKRFLHFPLSYNLNPNTNYFVNFIVKESTLTDGVTCRFKNTSTGITLGALKSSGIIATNANVADILEIYIDNTDDVANGLDAFIDDIMVIEYKEGMENWGIPYFEGMQSVKLPVLTTVGNNLIDKQTLKRGYIDENGVFIKNDNDMATDYIKILPNKKLTYKVFTNANYTTRFSFFNENKSMISRTNAISVTNGGYATYESPSNACYVRVHSNNFNVIGFDADISLVMSDTPLTSYEPYKSNILTVNEDVELRGIGNVKDELNCLTGEVTERIGEIVLDGSQNVASWWNTTSTVGVSISIPTMKNISNLVCDRLPVVYYRDINNDTYDTDGIASWDSGNIVRFRILKSKLITADIDGIISYLQSNPITVQYELVSESVKKVDLSVFNQNGNKLMKIKPIEGTMNISTSSDTIQPTFSGEIPVEAITQNLSSFIKE